ncbi:bifunctional diguanylate cyclase/phosphodiesterase [Exiguobacterium sp. TBG-PICH-001]|uniref:putative bifunctional diguanylate cyclase/phosphodiesterase n=1 Tax=Exiguobacterium abrahamii TaxID=2785532 RepID=UPI0018A7A547|nr:bifunctional diguanylate cyclase/phosphodiesterase [Exiguobacterium sp. TBG-PICH-001]
MLRRLSPVFIVEAFRRRSYYKTFSWMIAIIGLVALIVACQHLTKTLDEGYRFKASGKTIAEVTPFNHAEQEVTRYYLSSLNGDADLTQASEQANRSLEQLTDRLPNMKATESTREEVLTEIKKLQRQGYESNHRFFTTMTNFKSEIIFNQLVLSKETGSYYNVFSNLILMEEQLGKSAEILKDARQKEEPSSIDQLRIQQMRIDLPLRQDSLIKSLYDVIPLQNDTGRQDIAIMREQMDAYTQTLDDLLRAPKDSTYVALANQAEQYESSMYRLYDQELKQVAQEMQDRGNQIIRNAWLLFGATGILILGLLMLTLSLLRAFRQDLSLLKGEANTFAEDRRQSGYHVPARNDFQPVVQAFRTMTAIIAGLLDYNDAKTKEIKQKKAEIESLFSQNTDPILAMSSDYTIVNGNERFRQLTNATVGWTIEELIHPADLNRMRRALRRSLEGQSQTIRCKMLFDEKILNMFVNIIHVANKEDDTGVALYLSCHDETDQFRREERITQLALFDMLTGLLNRNGFEQKMADALKAPQPGELVTISVRQFRRINDIYGHGAGDQILKDLANRLKHHFIGTGQAARIGGDEFAVLVAQQDIVDYQKLKQVIEHVYEINGEYVNVSISMSMVRYPDDAVAVTSLLSSVDIAMQHAKQQTEGGPVWFESWMSAEYLESVALEAELREAIEKNELQLFYQPQINLATGQVDGCEALLRWFHPERGMISPAIFIPIAERSMLIEEIGMWVVAETVRQVEEWKDTELGVLRVSANLSVKELVSGRIVDYLTDVREIHPGIEQRMELEITESFGVFSDTRVFDALQTLHQMGYRLAIDDFGTGYSSLSYLSRLPIQRLKIDRSFISGPDACSNAPLIETIIKLAHTLKYDVVAEGIEELEQADHLRVLDCEYAQGFYYSRPIPADEFRVWYGKYHEKLLSE